MPFAIGTLCRELEVIEPRRAHARHRGAKSDLRRVGVDHAFDLAQRPRAAAHGTTGHVFGEARSVRSNHPQPQPPLSMIGRADFAAQANPLPTVRGRIDRLRDRHRQITRHRHRAIAMQALAGIATRRNDAIAEATVLPRHHVEAGRARRMERRHVGERLAGRDDLHRRRDRREQGVERTAERRGIGGVGHAMRAIDREPIPVDRRRRVARVEPAHHAVEAGERVQVGDLMRGRECGGPWRRPGAPGEREGRGEAAEQDIHARPGSHHRRRAAKRSRWQDAVIPAGAGR